jgi:hypothetical protein
MATSTHRRPSLCVRLTRALWFVLAVGSVKPKAHAKGPVAQINAHARTTLRWPMSPK